jgi:hypothetical protein
MLREPRREEYTILHRDRSLGRLHRPDVSYPTRLRARLMRKIQRPPPERFRVTWTTGDRPASYGPSASISHSQLQCAHQGV